MAVMSKINPKPEWHTEPLIIQELAKGNLKRKELKSKVRQLQKNHPDTLLKGNYHSDSTYNYWIRNLKERGLIKESENKELGLTDLGSWLANSKLSDLFNRISFLYVFTCRNCSNSHTVLMKPLLNKMRKDAKGNTWLSLQCSKCGAITLPTKLWPEKELISFYRDAIKELKQFVRLTAIDI